MAYAAVAAVTAELRAILLYKCAHFYNFCAALLILHMMANSAHVVQFCANVHKTSLVKVENTLSLHIPSDP